MVISILVFHRILDFKNGAGFLSGPFLFLTCTSLSNTFKTALAYPGITGQNTC
jgi:hypothetical protein